MSPLPLPIRSASLAIATAVMLIASGCFTFVSVGREPTPFGPIGFTDDGKRPGPGEGHGITILRGHDFEIGEDRTHGLALTFGRGDPPLALEPAGGDGAGEREFLRHFSGALLGGAFAGPIVKQMMESIPDALACKIRRPASPARDAALRCARAILADPAARVAGRIGNWRISSPILVSSDDQDLLGALLASASASGPGSVLPQTQHAAGSPVLRWDCSAGSRVLWKADVGLQVGALALADGMVLVGTTTAEPSRPDGKRGGRMMCFDAPSGQLLWQINHDPLPLRVNDIGDGIRSRPCVDQDRVYYVSNRGELVCANLKNGQRVWTLDMVGTLGIFKRDLNDAGSLAPSPIVDGDLVFCITGNGGDFDPSYQRQWLVPRPDAPSFMAVNRRSGKVVWSSNAPGRNILYGQWSTPAIATVRCHDIVLFPGGDGLLYAFDPPTGKLLWTVDCRQPSPLKGMTDFIVAPPLVHGEMAYVSLNRDIEQGGGRPHALLAIDLRTPSIRWTLTEPAFDGSFGPMAIRDGVLYAAGFSGELLAIDAKTGQVHWNRHDTDQQTTGGVTLDGGKIYIADDGGVDVISARCGCGLGRFELNELVGTALTAIDGNVLYAAANGHLWALRAWGSALSDPHRKALNVRPGT